MALQGTTGWGLGRETALRQFLRTETGSAAILLAATLAALAWANLAPAGYQAWWHTELSDPGRPQELGLTLREWVNSGLMTFFFLVAGLEARREFDLGELRERRRLALPLAAGLGGLVVPIGIYLAINAGQPTVGGWGTAMSTDTAFALGMLALVGPRLPDRVRTYLLTFAIVDDLVALTIIAFVYSGRLDWPPLLAGLAVLAAGRGGPVRRAAQRAAVRGGGRGGLGGVLRVRRGPDLVTGLLMGLMTAAYPAARLDLEAATEVFRRFREQPTAELAQTARAGVRSAISPNARLQQICHPWTSYVIVPLFALANAGITISGPFLARAFTSPVTLGIVARLRAGQAGRHDRRRVAGSSGSAGAGCGPPVGWAAVTGAGTIAGIGFTVSLLVATLAFTGTRLAGGQGRHAGRRARRVGADLAGLPGHQPAAAAAAGPGAAGHRADHHRPGRAGRPAVRPHPRPGEVPGHGGGVRGLRVPLLRRGRAGHPRPAGRLRRRALRVAAPAADRRAPARPASRRGRRGGGPAGPVLGDARPAAGPPGRADPPGPGAATRPSWGWTPRGSAPTCAARRARPRSRRTSTRPT